MRVAMAVMIGAGAMLGTAPCAAQTISDLVQLKTQMPLPDAKGNDPDLLCFAVMASAANDAKDSGKPDRLLDSAAGYYAGRLAVRYPDSATSLRPWVARLLSQSSNDSAGPFRLPCMQRYGFYLTGLMDALQGGKADAK